MENVIAEVDTPSILIDVNEVGKLLKLKVPVDPVCVHKTENPTKFARVAV